MRTRMSGSRKLQGASWRRLCPNLKNSIHYVFDDYKHCIMEILFLQYISIFYGLYVMLILHSLYIHDNVLKSVTCISTIHIHNKLVLGLYNVYINYVHI